MFPNCGLNPKQQTSIIIVPPYAGGPQNLMSVVHRIEPNRS